MFAIDCSPSDVANEARLVMTPTMSGLLVGRPGFPGTSVAAPAICRSVARPDARERSRRRLSPTNSGLDRSFPLGKLALPLRLQPLQPQNCGTIARHICGWEGELTFGAARAVKELG